MLGTKGSALVRTEVCFRVWWMNKTVSAVSAENIFANYVGRDSIFKDKRVLTSAFIPERIPHRENEIRLLTNVLAPVLKGYSTNNAFIYGTVGTGKTICCRFVLSQLEEAARVQAKSVRALYLNCKMKKVADTEYRLLAQLLKGLGVAVPDTGLPTDALYHRLFEKIDEKKQHVIIALDEIDAIFKKAGDGFLYSLTRTGGELRNAGITMIGITNDVSFLDGLDARVRSSLSEEELVFKPYDAMQLQDILQARAAEGFQPNAVGADVISLCAARAAQEHGDARRALDMLRIAGEIAERNSESTVTERHINEAQERIDVERAVEIIKAQPKQSQAVLAAIIRLTESQKKQGRWSDKRLLTGSVYEAYRIMCERNGLKPLTQRRVGDLISELDMLGIISTKVISKGRYGRTREITLSLNESVTAKAERILSERLY